MTIMYVFLKMALICPSFIFDLLFFMILMKHKFEWKRFVFNFIVSPYMFSLFFSELNLNLLAFGS